MIFKNLFTIIFQKQTGNTKNFLNKKIKQRIIVSIGFILTFLNIWFVYYLAKVIEL